LQSATDSETFKYMVSTLSDEVQPLILSEGFDAELCRFFQFRPGPRPRNKNIGFSRDTARDLCAKALRFGFGFIAGEFFELACEYNRLA